MKERRKYPRIEVATAVSLSVTSELGMAANDYDRGLSFCSSRDLSPEGIQLDLRDCLVVGARVKLDIALEDPAEIFVRSGRVAWVRNANGRFSYATGIMFADSSSMRCETWHKALESRFGLDAGGRALVGAG